MPRPEETAYPLIKSKPSKKELNEVYTPTQEDLGFAARVTKTQASRLSLLVLLKTFQRLGYFLTWKEIPEDVLNHVAQTIDAQKHLGKLSGFDTSGARIRQLEQIRIYLQIQAYGEEAKGCLLETALQAAQTKQQLIDIINASLEEMIRKRYELPAFSSLLRAARKARTVVNDGYYKQVYLQLSDGSRFKINQIFQRESEEVQSLWDRIKREPKRPTLNEMRELISQLKWLQSQAPDESAFQRIPAVKIRHFVAEAKALDLASLRDLKEAKRFTFAASLIRSQVAQTLDDLAEMYIKRIHKMRSKAKEAFADYQLSQLDETSLLVGQLKEMVIAFQADGSATRRIEKIQNSLKDAPSRIIERCEAHQALTAKSWYAFLPQFYNTYRRVLFQFIESVPLISTSQDRSLEGAIQFLIERNNTKDDVFEFPLEPTVEGRAHCPALSWASDKWRGLLLPKSQLKAKLCSVDRKTFEIALFLQIFQELKSGDLCIPGSDQYSDYRDQLISWSEYQSKVSTYAEKVGLSLDPAAFVKNIQAELEKKASQVDRTFPKNDSVRIEKGEPILSRVERKKDPPGLKIIERLIKERLEPVSVLDILVDTENWLGWSKYFKPISGFESKLENPKERYLNTVFTYGCNLGPSQAARSIPGLNRKQVSFTNQRHVTEEDLDQAITAAINAFGRCDLPKLWGSSKSAAADGTQWDLYKQNLLSEYHIRYGGYGGIAYYHVCNNYIALFSHFIPCGVWEGVYIIDGLIKNKSDLQPDTLHGDTQAQSTPVFGLSYLLGFDLMPRIRNWKDLKLFRHKKGAHYEHIDPLFDDEAIDWKLIETHLPDMLRVAISIHSGKVSASTILRRLGTYSKKNRLYFAFQELGRVIRTLFLLRYLSDKSVRSLIQGATNKTEAFHYYTKWMSFGGEGFLPENIRDEQCKRIKYNHLVSNLAILHTTVSITRAAKKLKDEGHDLRPEILAVLSPYQTEHINRFGHYKWNWKRRYLSPEYKINLPPLTKPNIS